jgi:hypothetical protein
VKNEPRFVPGDLIKSTPKFATLLYKKLGGSKAGFRLIMGEECFIVVSCVKTDLQQPLWLFTNEWLYFVINLDATIIGWIYITTNHDCLIVKV